eukprot:878178-Pyramimonas_sp.AAC.1
MADGGAKAAVEAQARGGSSKHTSYTAAATLPLQQLHTLHCSAAPIAAAPLIRAWAAHPPAYRLMPRAVHIIIYGGAYHLPKTARLSATNQYH